MKMSTTAVLVIGAVVAACDPRATEQSVTDDLAAIGAVNARTLEALNSGDWARLNELTDDNYVAIIRGTPTSGRERLEAANRRFLEQWKDEEAWLPEETIIDGDLAFQRGSFTMTLTPRQGGGEARSLTGSYLHIYQRKPDGSWGLTRAMAETAAE
jgi:ketosteroid isomerase-like protein